MNDKVRHNPRPDYPPPPPTPPRPVVTKAGKALIAATGPEWDATRAVLAIEAEASATGLRQRFEALLYDEGGVDPVPSVLAIFDRAVLDTGSEAAPEDVSDLDLATLLYVRESIHGIEHVGGTVRPLALIDSIIETRVEVRGEAAENPDFGQQPGETT